jgi:hypothetical protein
MSATAASSYRAYVPNLTTQQRLSACEYARREVALIKHNGYKRFRSAYVEYALALHGGPGSALDIDADVDTSIRQAHAPDNKYGGTPDAIRSRLLLFGRAIVDYSPLLLDVLDANSTAGFTYENFRQVRYIFDVIRAPSGSPDHDSTYAEMMWWAEYSFGLDAKAGRRPEGELVAITDAISRCMSYYNQMYFPASRASATDAAYNDTARRFAHGAVREFGHSGAAAAAAAAAAVVDVAVAARAANAAQGIGGPAVDAHTRSEISAALSRMRASAARD